MNNIFEGAKFGDKFLTKNSHPAVLLGIYDDYVCICTDDGTIESSINLDGSVKYDPLDESTDYSVVCKYQEPIDEDKLDELAEEYNNKQMFEDELEELRSKMSFKAGYRKAMEE